MVVSASIANQGISHSLQHQFTRHMTCLLPAAKGGHSVVALSGGSDSMALLMLTQAFCNERGGRLTAVTVDHKLRPESSAEAKQVAKWLKFRGVDHQILEWNHPGKVDGNLQANARRARYCLLEAACRELGATVLLTGHTEDDQAETVALREQRGAGVVGLAAMAVKRPLNSELMLVRPLLTTPKEALREYLVAHSQPWVEDPSNENEVFDRIRIRKRLRNDKAEQDRLLTIAKEMGERRRAIELDVNRWMEVSVQQYGAGCSISVAALKGLNGAGEISSLNTLQYMALCRLLKAAGHKEGVPRFHKVQRLYQHILHVPTGASTLAFCKVQWRRGTVTFMPEKPVIGTGFSRKSLVEEPFYPIYLAS